GGRRAPERLHAPPGGVGRQLRARTRLRARAPSGPARLVFAVDADEQEDQKAGDAADDERHRAAEADRAAADPDEEPEEEGPHERRDAVVESGEAEVHRARSYRGGSPASGGPKKIHR